MINDKIKTIGRGKGWVCIHKPSGISVHNDPGKDMISCLPSQLAQEDQGPVLHPLHRLDKETSGLLLLATESEALTRLSTLFAQGKIKKRYKALVHGNFDLPAQGVWDTPLSKQAGGRRDPRGKGKKVWAETRYRVLTQSAHYALVEIELVTGRKHQIRRHAKLAGHPVAGNKRYGSPRSLKFLREQKNFQGMGLHSCFLEFTDQGKTITLELPGLPRDMERLLAEDM